GWASAVGTASWGVLDTSVPWAASVMRVAPFGWFLRPASGSPCSRQGTGPERCAWGVRFGGDTLAYSPEPGKAGRALDSFASEAGTGARARFDATSPFFWPSAVESAVARGRLRRGRSTRRSLAASRSVERARDLLSRASGAFGL